MAKRNAEGVEKAHRPRPPRVFVLEMGDGSLQFAELEMIKLMAEEGDFDKVKSVWSAKPVYVRKVEVIKIGAPRKSKKTQEVGQSK